MKNKTLVIVAILVLVSGLLGGQIVRVSTAFAHDNDGESITVSRDSEATDTESEEEVSSTAHIEDEQENQDVDVENDNNEEMDNGDEHQNRVNDIVHKLQEVADKHDEVGDDINEVIREEASSSEDAANAMRDLDHESGFKKFFLGPDFGSLGELRSTIVTTQNHIDRLVKAQERVTDPTAKATLETQINALKDVASSTQAFLDSHEQVFSLLGWLVRFFSGK